MKGMKRCKNWNGIRKKKKRPGERKDILFLQTRKQSEGSNDEVKSLRIGGVGRIGTKHRLLFARVQLSEHSEVGPTRIKGVLARIVSKLVGRNAKRNAHIEVSKKSANGKI
jgi:hypothetical protein